MSSDVAARRVEEMRLRRVELRPDGVAGLADEAARACARAGICCADLQVDDVVGAERLDDMRLDREVAGGRLARDEHAFRPDAERQIGARLLAAASCAGSSAGKSKAPSPSPIDDARRRAVRSRDRRRGDVHHRAADELRDEEIGRMLVDLGRACRPAAARPRS